MASQRRKCSAHKTNGEPCDAWAIKGGFVCVTHGGGAGQVKAAAARRLQAAEARDAVLELGLTVGTGRIDPRDALELELWRTHVLVQMYEALVADLKLESGGIYGPLYHASGVLTGRAEPHVLVTLRDAERDRLARVAFTAARAGVEERRQQLAERQVDLAQKAFEAMLEEMGLNAGQRQEARKAYARHLRSVA